MKPEEALQYIKDNSISAIHLKFNQLPGPSQHLVVTARELNAADDTAGGIFTKGINKNNLLLIPDPDTAVLDPVCEEPTLTMICDLVDPLTKKPSPKDPRYIAKKAEQYLKATGLAEVCCFGPKAEFFIFDEAEWNNSKEEFSGPRPPLKDGYSQLPPQSLTNELGKEIMLATEKAGIKGEMHLRGTVSGKQAKVNLESGSLTQIADQITLYKYIVKNVARKQNKIATFMPKPLAGASGSSMHTQVSLWNNNINLFYDPAGYALLSRNAKYFIGGLLKHAASLMAFCAPTTNSYKKLVPVDQSPVNLIYSQINGSAAIRIPEHSENLKSKWVEFMPADCSCNPYLAFSAMLLAGLDGIHNKIDPGNPVDQELHELPPRTAEKISRLPRTLQESLEALEKDHSFLFCGDVFTRDVIDEWIQIKRENEIEEVRTRPHPYEYDLYFDI
ncbi:MAG: type I glutamate--ammonia ligase [Eubacteriales bacterium]|jgi:glutamine synthetase